jgi:hypothetical protein
MNVNPKNTKVSIFIETNEGIEYLMLFAKGERVEKAYRYG